jgi:hypothetical protein
LPMENPTMDLSLKANSRAKESIEIKLKYFLKEPILIISLLKEPSTIFPLTPFIFLIEDKLFSLKSSI